MIERLGDLKTRIERWIKEKRKDDKPFYDLVNAPNQVIVRETNEAGEAHVECIIPEGSHCFVWHLESTGYFGFLKEGKTADGAFFICHEDGRIDAYIVECKKTMGASEWEKAKNQLQASLSQILALAGFLGIELAEVYLGAAFRVNRLDPEQSADLRFGPRLLEGDTSEASRKVQGRAQEMLEWSTSQVHLRGFAKPFSLAKIQLDPETGRGCYAPPNP